MSYSGFIPKRQLNSRGQIPRYRVIDTRQHTILRTDELRIAEQCKAWAEIRGTRYTILNAYTGEELTNQTKEPKIERNHDDENYYHR